MGTRLAGKVAIITGSTSGIGRACAELFAEEGAAVVVNGRRRELGEAVAAGIRAKGGTAIFVCADITEASRVRELIRSAVREFGRLDILMNNAWSGTNASVLDVPDDDWDQAYASTVKAVVVACREAIPEMIKVGGGSIINTSSVHGVLAAKASAPYDTFKAALINLSRQMAVDFGRQNIRVNAFCPGRIVTEGKVKFLEARPDEVRRQKYTYLLGRPGTMREAATAALFLASDDSSFVTGHALVVDGGLTARVQDDAAKFVEEQVLKELGCEGE